MNSGETARLRMTGALSSLNRKNHKLAVIMILLLLVSVLVFASYSRLGMNTSKASPDAKKEANRETVPEVVLACPGRVEGMSEVINSGWRKFLSKLRSPALC